MSFSISDAFPPFNFDINNIKKEYIDLFTVQQVINKLDGDKIISTSLYYSPHALKHRESHELWEKKYIEPITKHINNVNNDWYYEIFISPDCEKYIEKLKHPKIQFNLMKYNSNESVPGMFWRYIPLLYKDKYKLFVGMDTPQIPSTVYDYSFFLKRNYKIIRWSFFHDIGPAGFFIYKPMKGSFLSNFHDDQIVYAMAAWIQFEKERIEKLRTESEILNQPSKIFYRTVLYQDVEYRIFGTHNEKCYGQDENFLSCYLYPKYKDELVTVLKLVEKNRFNNNLAINVDRDSRNNATIIYDTCIKSL